MHKRQYLTSYWNLHFLCFPTSMPNTTFCCFWRLWGFLEPPHPHFPSPFKAQFKDHLSFKSVQPREAEYAPSVHVPFTLHPHHDSSTFVLLVFVALVPRMVPGPWWMLTCIQCWYSRRIHGNLRQWMDVWHALWTEPSPQARFQV